MSFGSKILIFDTETTGLPKHRTDFTLTGQPWPVSFAGILADENGNVIAEESFIINLPNVIDSDPRAEAVHGISRARMTAEGIPPMEAAARIRALATQAQTVMAYNFPFDDLILKAFIYRIADTDGLDPGDWVYGEGDRTCLMKLASGFLSARFGHTASRKHRLGQAYKMVLGKPMQDAHTAQGDTLAAYELLRGMFSILDTAVSAEPDTAGVSHEAPAANEATITPVEPAHEVLGASPADSSVSSADAPGASAPAE